MLPSFKPGRGSWLLNLISTVFVRLMTLVILVLGAALVAQVPSASDPPKFVLPPPQIVAAFDAEPLPQTTVSPNRQVLLLTKARPYPTIAELSQPMLRLAGLRSIPTQTGSIDPWACPPPGSTR